MVVRIRSLVIFRSRASTEIEKTTCFMVKRKKNHIFTKEKHNFPFFIFQKNSPSLSNPPSFPFRFQKSQNITLSNWSFDVSGDGSLVVNEFNSDLGTLTLRAGSADDGDDFGVSRLVGFVHGCFFNVVFSGLSKLFLK